MNVNARMRTLPFLVALTLAVPALAAPSKETEAVTKPVKTVVQSVRYERDAAALKHFGSEEQGKFLLGDAWAKGTDAQREEFKQLFQGLFATALEPGELLMGTPGYTFGLGFMVRRGPGVASVPGSPGEFMWAGYSGPFFWVDPAEQLVAVMMNAAPGPSRAYYRREIKALVHQAIVE